MNKIKTKFSEEKTKLKSEIGIAEFIYWWVMRGTLIYAIIMVDNTMSKLLFLFHLSSTFVIDIVHMIFPKGSFFNILSFRIQSLLAYTAFFGTFIGSYIYIYSYFEKYDLILHFISGITVVIIGYYFAITMVEPNSKKHNQLISLFGFSFSGMLAAIWEVVEFFGDYFAGTNNQSYTWAIPDDFLMFKIIGKGANVTGQYPLYDTILDLVFAFASTIFATIGLYIFLEHKRKKTKKANLLKAESMEKEKISA